MSLKRIAVDMLAWAEMPRLSLAGHLGVSPQLKNMYIRSLEARTTLSRKHIAPYRQSVEEYYGK